MAVNSKSKGSKFERTIAKQLAKWTGYEFGRVPGSGSLRWKKTDNITGDIVCTDPKHARRFPFNIECKSYKELKFEHVILELKSCKILGFWDQACNDAERAGKIPILVMKYNSMPKGEAFFTTQEHIGTWLLKEYKLKHMVVDNGTQRLYIFLLSQVIEHINYNSLYKFIRKLKST